MQTKGVLIIDTGEILSESGEMEEPARDIVKPGDYIVAFDQNRIQCKQDLLEDLARSLRRICNTEGPPGKRDDSPVPDAGER